APLPQLSENPELGIEEGRALGDEQFEEAPKLHKRLFALQEILRVIGVLDVVSIFIRKLQVQNGLDQETIDNLLLVSSFGLKNALSPKDVLLVVKYYSEEKRFNTIETVQAKQAMLRLCDALVGADILLPEVIRIIKFFNVRPVKDIQKQLLNLSIKIMTRVRTAQGLAQEDIETVIDVFLKTGDLKNITDDNALKNLFELSKDLSKNETGRAKVVKILEKIVDSGFLAVGADVEAQKSLLQLSHELLRHLKAEKTKEVMSVLIKVIRAFAQPGVLAVHSHIDVQKSLLQLCCGFWAFFKVKKPRKVKRVLEEALGAFENSGILSGKLDVDVQEYVLSLCQELILAGMQKSKAAFILILFSTQEQLSSIVTQKDKKAFLYLVVTLFENKTFTQELFNFFKQVAQNRDLVDDISRWYLATLFIKACLKWSSERNFVATKHAFELLNGSDLNDLKKNTKPDFYNTFYTQLLDMYVRILKRVLYDWREAPIFKWFFGATSQEREQREDLLEKLKEQAVTLAKTVQTDLAGNKFFQPYGVRSVILDWCQKMLKVKTFDVHHIAPILKKLAEGNESDLIVKRAIGLLGLVGEKVEPVAQEVAFQEHITKLSSALQKYKDSLVKLAREFVRVKRDILDS
ncbi:MAG: hypothetical protein V1855_04780, partial [bacterium]